MSYIDQLERELLRAGRERQRRPAWVPAISLTDAGLTVAATAALVIALVAIALLGHRTPGHERAGAPAVPPAAARLVSQLGVLRRAQTAADRSLSAGVGRGYIPGLLRLAVARPGLRVFVAVYPYASGGVWPIGTGDQVALLTASGADTQQLSQPVPSVALRDPTLAHSIDGYLIGLIPDGVHQVLWRYGVGKRIMTAVANVVDNVAVARVDTRAAVSQPGTIWLAADGHRVPTTPGVVVRQINRWLANSHATVAPGTGLATHRVAPVLLRDFPALHTGPTSTPDFTVRSVSQSAAGPIVGGAAQPGEPTQIDLRHVLAVRTRTGLRFWIAPGANGICIFANDTGACPDDLASVLSGGMWAVVHAPDGTAMYVGVVPRSMRKVTFDVTAGGTRTVPAIDGIVITPDAGLGARRP